MNERHAYRLIRDLFDHKEVIFGELKRQSSTLGSLGGPAAATHGARPAARVRAVSIGDESNRRAAMEARAKAISERTRDKSPAATNRHRRDKSTDGGMGMRFPVVASPTATAQTPTARTSLGGIGNRQSLEVPGSHPTSPEGHDQSPPGTKTLPGAAEATPAAPMTNGNAASTPQMPGTFIGGGPAPHIPGSFTDGPAEASPPTSEAEVQSPVKRSAVGSGGRTGRGGGLGRESFRNVGQKDGLEAVILHRGVTLEDKPMDD